MSYQNDDYPKKYEPLWGSWHIEKSVGQGSFGKVYKISKEEWGYKYESALKVISIPSMDQYHEAVAAIGNDEKLLNLYFEDAVKNIINEIVVLYKLRGNSNIVSYEDHMVEKQENKAAWDILIRMEYLTPLNKHLENKSITIDDVLNIGIDICTALELCSKNGIIHRDIKEENIFVSKEDCFKLGDFGIAREFSKSLSASIRGTPLYMAPEVYRGETYDVRSDLYSLGILLYKLSNNGRFPFMPPYPMELRISDSEASVEKRLSGNEIPLPCNVPHSLGEIIIKMCQFKPENRFSTPSAAKEALTEISSKMTPEERNKVVSPNKNAATEKLSCNSFVVPDTVLLPQAQLSKEQQNHKPILYNSIENTAANILNGGLACLKDNFILLSLPDYNHNIFKLDAVNNQITKLNSHESWFINVYENWIYYSNSSNMEQLYRLNMEGSINEKISNDNCWYVNVKENWIYYSNEGDKYKLYKIRMDGKGRTKLNEDESHNISLYENWIYYTNKSDGGKLYRMGTNGEAKEKITNKEVSYFCLSDNMVYFVNKSDGMKLYKMDLHNRKTEKLNNDISSNINIYNEWIYYCNKSDGGKLYRISTDGREKSKLNDEYTDYINIVGGYIYYCDRSKNKLYKISCDGAEKTAINIPDKAKQIFNEEWIYI